MVEERALSGESESNKENLEYFKKIEAILFISGKFMSLPELISISDLNPIIIREAINNLKEKYQSLDSALEIIEKRTDEGEQIWKMDVKAEHYSLTNRIAAGTSEFSKAEQETLATISYKQPVKQSVIVKIRGNKSYDHIKKFVDLGLVKKKKLGHTYELSLSEEFYNYFNVEKEEMPEK